MSAKIEFHFENPDESPGFLLWQITMLWQRKVKRALDSYAITHTQFVLMATIAWLSGSNDNVMQTDIATHSKTDRMMVSKVLRTLQQKGLVGRQEHKTDTRAKSVVLTAKGQQLLQQALKTVENEDIKFFSVLKNRSKTFTSDMLILMEKNI